MIFFSLLSLVLQTIFAFKSVTELGLKFHVENVFFQGTATAKGLKYRHAYILGLVKKGKFFSELK